MSDHVSPRASVVNGACICGGVTVRFKTAGDHFDACHCVTCRAWGGGPLLTVDVGSELTLMGEELISVYSSSEWAERGFCKRCGSHLFYRLKANDFRNVPLGLLKGTEHLQFHLQVFIDHKPAQYAFVNETEVMTGAEVFAKYMPPES